MTSCFQSLKFQLGQRGQMGQNVKNTVIEVAPWWSILETSSENKKWSPYTADMDQSKNLCPSCITADFS